MRRRGVLRGLLRFGLFGADSELPGDTSQSVTVYVVRCPEGHYDYRSLKWVRDKCPECGRKMDVKESE